MKYNAILSFAAVLGVVGGVNADDGGSIMMEMERAITHDLEIPDPFIQGDMEICADNAVIANWCDSSHMTASPTALKCGMLKAFKEYACACPDHPSLCPTECLEGTTLIAKTRSSIRCRGFPVDSPNYIMQEMHKHHLHDCADNAMVNAWCDDFVNPHVECSLFSNLDQYVCRCSGKASNCPDECLDGGDALIRTRHGVVCTGIPKDTINYEM